MRLSDLGFGPFQEPSFAPYASRGLVPGRVAFESRETYRVLTGDGERLADLSGRLRHSAGEPADLPAVGDWVALRDVPSDGFGLVEAVLPRASRLLRKAAGEGCAAQLLAANVDVLLVAASLEREPNERSLERYLAMAREGGVRPVVLLTKGDLDARGAERALPLSALLGGVEVIAVSAASGAGLDRLGRLLAPGSTAALAGPSGAGKSTLVNRLLGEERQATRTVREEDLRGRHATTARQLFVLPSGALLVDTPGLRELGLLDGASVAAGFPEIEGLARGCRFRDCSHDGEPGCAVARAAASGEIDPARVEARAKLVREAESLALRQSVGAARAERLRWKAFTGRPARERARALRDGGGER